MSELNRELKEYLSRNGNKSYEDKESMLPVTIKDIKISKLTSWFNNNNSSLQEDDNLSTESNTSTASGSSWFSSAQSDPCFPSLGRKQRILGFLCCVSMGIICFSLAAIYAPLLLIKARKFSLLFTLGSLFSILSFSFLWGPVNHLKHMFSSQRIIFTTVYITSLFATLYFALSLQSTILTTVAAFIQVGSLVCFIVSNIPGGQTGLKFFSSICSSILKRTVSKVLPV